MLLYTGCQKYTHTHTHGKVASMNLQLQLAKVEKLSLSAPTKFVMSRLLASAFVKRAREREAGRERERVGALPACTVYCRACLGGGVGVAWRRLHDGLFA